MDEIQKQLDKGDQLMQKAYAHTQLEFSKIRAGRAMPDMLDGISIMYYDAMTPLNQVAAITTPDARTLIIKPWEKRCISEIEKAILNSKLGLNPQNDGEVVRITIPPLTEERRKDLVKQVKNEAEKGRVVIRNIRKDIKESLKHLQKEGASEDMIKKAEEKLQQLTDKHIQHIDTLLSHKEVEILEV
ncbi:MAG: ribosome recycling factor [Candidatus Amoebophilus sp. 36-38]|nr:MAG: ribosome recycling factor [Candidatus Amoebophilus sp. 36-38]